MSGMFEYEEIVSADYIIAMLEQTSPGIKKRIVQTYHAWNKPIREILRAETGFRLVRQSVPVEIVDGLPFAFYDALGEIKGLEWLLVARQKLDATMAGLIFLEENYNQAITALEKVKASGNHATADDILRCSNFVYALGKAADHAKTLDKIIGIDQDVMGAYFHGNRPSVALFWCAIAIISLAEGIEPEALTIVVLAHELAHAYTMLGCDMDGKQWDDRVLRETDRIILEGIAQFYTEVVCQRISDRYPKALEAFNQILKNQSPPYTTYRSWFPQNAFAVEAMEAMHASIIICRSKHIKVSEIFAEVISDNLTRYSRE